MRKTLGAWAILVAGLTACSTSSTAGLHVVTPAASTPPAASPAPATFQPKTLLDYSGTGPGNTPSFDAGVTGNFNVYWRYSGNNTVCPDGCDAAHSVEFGIQENAETAGPGVNGSGYPFDLMPDSGSGIVTMQGDPGTHSFTVSAVPGCKWTIKVLLEP